jgi:alcohol dehydrogenase (NADP+)
MAHQRLSSIASHLEKPSATMSYAPAKFQGWMGLDKSAAEGKMKFQAFEPKPFKEEDIDIKITHCGVCGSDLHTLRSGWGNTSYPVCVGHEIVGTAVKVGSKAVHGIKLVTPSNFYEPQLTG